MAGGVLYVEGKDDEHFILHLLLRHAIDLQTPPVSIKSAGNDSKVLDQIVEGVKGAAGEGRPSDLSSMPTIPFPTAGHRFPSDCMMRIFLLVRG
jgi:hypothetical protein